MKSEIKQFLLAGTALVAVTVQAAPAFAATVEVNGGSQLVSSDPRDDPAIRYVTDHGAGVGSGINLTGTGADAVTADAPGIGTLTLNGNNIITGDVGIAGGNQLNRINITPVDTTVTFNGDVAADDISISSGPGHSGTVIFNGNSAGEIYLDENHTLEIGDGGIHTGNIYSPSDATGTVLTFNGEGEVTGRVVDLFPLGTINAGADGKTVTFGDEVGADTLNITGQGTVDLGGWTGVKNGIAFKADGTLTVSDGADLIDSDVDNETGSDGAGTLHFKTSASLLGNVGTTNSLKEVTLDDGVYVTASDIAATDVTIGQNATLSAREIVGDVTMNGTALYIESTGGGGVDGDITATGGILQLENGNGNFTGDITGLDAIRITANQTMKIAGDVANRVVDADNMVLYNGAMLEISSPGGAGNSTTITGPITALNDGQGEVRLALGTGTVNFGGALGTDSAALNILQLMGGVDPLTVNTAHDLYVDNITIRAEDTLNLLGTGQVVSGIIDGGGKQGQINVGSASVDADVTFGGVIGGGNTIKGFRVYDGSTAGISQNLFADSNPDALGGKPIAIAIDGRLDVDASGNSVTIDAVGGDIDINGAVYLTGNNTVTIDADSEVFVDGLFSSALGGAQTNFVSAGVGTRFGAAGDTTLVVGNRWNLDGGAAFGSNGHILTINIAPAAGFDPTLAPVIVSNGAVTFAPGSETRFGLASGSDPITIGAQVTLLQKTGGDDITAALADGRIVLPDTAYLHFVDDGSVADMLTVKIAANNSGDVLAGSYAQAGANVILNGGGATGEMVQARNNLLLAPDAAAANQIAESLVPVVNGGHFVATQNVTNTTRGLADNRLAALRTGETGMAAGNGAQGRRVWGQAFGSTATQDRRGGVDGYDADTYGFAFGADTENLLRNGIVGVAFSYGDTDVDSNNGFGATSAIDTYQLALYGDYDLGQDKFVDGMLAYAWSDVDSVRYNVGAIGQNASASFDAHQFTAQAALGRDYRRDGMVLTPRALAHWTHYRADSYSESGAGALNMNVDQESLNIFELGMDVTASWRMDMKDGMQIVPSLHAGYRYDFVGDAIETTASFTGGGAAFDTNGADPAQHKFNAGAELTLHTTRNWDISAHYDFEFKSDYDAHAGFLRAGVKF